MRAAACGTESGYRRHLRDDIVPCRPCCDGHAAHMARWRGRAAVTAPEDPLRYRAARLGHEPAEALTTHDRHRLVAELHRAGWTDRRIATHARMTTYTTARIRAGLGLLPNRPSATTRGAA
jgi:hypothetical protein